MNTKILVLFLVLASLFVSGCAEEDAGQVEADEAVVSDTGAEEQGVDEQDEGLPEGPTKDHTVRLEYYEVMKPSELEISRGDTVSWWSYKRQGTYVLVSEEGLFQNTELEYSVPFSYTFNKAGTYSFTVEDVQAMNMTVMVK